MRLEILGEVVAADPFDEGVVRFAGALRDEEVDPASVCGGLQRPRRQSASKRRLATIKTISRAMLQRQVLKPGIEQERVGLSF